MTIENPHYLTYTIATIITILLLFDYLCNIFVISYIKYISYIFIILILAMNNTTFPLLIAIYGFYIESYIMIYFSTILHIVKKDYYIVCDHQMIGALLTILILYYGIGQSVSIMSICGMTILNICWYNNYDHPKFLDHINLASLIIIPFVILNFQFVHHIENIFTVYDLIPYMTMILLRNF